MSVSLRAGGASARINLKGAEPVSWIVGGRERFWQGDPAIWGRSAPLLFPVVGACRRGRIAVAGREYPMPQHGFAKDAAFAVVAHSESWAHLRLADSEASREIFPFAFRLDIRVTISADRLAFEYEVFNPGPSVLPYAIGFHPGFAWPPEEGEIVFDRPEIPDIPCIAPGGLLARRTRRAPLAAGRVLPLRPGLFDGGALVFLHARSSGMTLRSASGTELRMSGEGFGHLAVWSRPGAPFIALECWSGHAEREGTNEELVMRESMTQLGPGQSTKHVVFVFLSVR